MASTSTFHGSVSLIQSDTLQSLMETAQCSSTHASQACFTICFSGAADSPTGTYVKGSNQASNGSLAVPCHQNWTDISSYLYCKRHTGLNCVVQCPTSSLVLVCRDAEVLSLFAAIINKLKDRMQKEVPKIFEAVFQVTLQMITKDFSVRSPPLWAYAHMSPTVRRICAALLMRHPICKALRHEVACLAHGLISSHLLPLFLCNRMTSACT